MREANLGVMNKSLVAMAAWLVIKDPSSFAAVIMKGKKIQHISVWKAPNLVPKSTFWASVLKILS